MRVCVRITHAFALLLPFFFQSATTKIALFSMLLLLFVFFFCFVVAVFSLRFINHQHNLAANICCDFIIVFDAFLPVRVCV